MQDEMKTAKGKWKDSLLSSSLPLEFEIAKLLASAGFAISADYTYSRIDAGVTKDFSVDILAHGFIPLGNPNSWDATLLFLIECKFRSPNRRWLFLPEPNVPDFSPFSQHTIRVMDVFSAYTMESEHIRQVDAELERVYKGAEIDLSRGAVYEAEIRHGVSQLRYALPRLFSDEILRNAYQAPDPFIICPILVTTAPLYIARKDAGIAGVRNAATLDDIAVSHPYCVLYSDYGPDFEDHCRRQCSELGNIRDHDPHKIYGRRAASAKYAISTPFALAEGFARADRFSLVSNFTQFIICTQKSFGDLIRRITQAATEDVKTIKQVCKPVKRKRA